MNPTDWQDLRSHLLRFAVIQVKYADAAEDLVQEAILAAYSKIESFRRESGYETWVFGILKHKIADYLRGQNRRQAMFVETDEEYDLDACFAAQFDSSGHWLAEDYPDNWQNPEQNLSNSQFRQIFEVCLYGLPENTARVFMMRQILGFDSEEVCEQCNISISNFHTTMHRAREGLRQCLQIKWFNGTR